jgi:hypothetical protein
MENPSPRAPTAREAASDKSYDALAAAHSRAVAQLARDVADATRGIAATAPARPLPVNR